MVSNLSPPEFWKNSPNLLPSISVDCVIFGFKNDQLKILLLKFKNTDYYALPGGFVEYTENIEIAAAKVLERRTGLHDIYLEQFHVFGDGHRRFDELHKEIMRINGVELKSNHYIFNRFVSIGYFALIDFTKATAIPKPDNLSESCDWYEIDLMPNLIFDHNIIVAKALEKLRFMFDERLIEFNRWAFPLLPENFTMIELQSLYETILGRKLLRANFQRKMLSLGILERLEKKMTGAANKAPYLYRLIDKA